VREYKYKEVKNYINVNNGELNMKKLLIGLTLLASISSFAGINSYNVKGFTKLEHSKLAKAIQEETRSLTDVSILSLKGSIGNYVLSPLEFFGGLGAQENNDQDWLILKFKANINDSIEILECDVVIFKDRERIALKDCMNSRSELADDYIQIDFDKIGVKRIQQRNIIN
jgi:hypothetical protein